MPRPKKSASTAPEPQAPSEQKFAMPAYLASPAPSQVPLPRFATASPSATPKPSMPPPAAPRNAPSPHGSPSQHNARQPPLQPPSPSPAFARSHHMQAARRANPRAASSAILSVPSADLAAPAHTTPRRELFPSMSESSLPLPAQANAKVDQELTAQLKSMLSLPIPAAVN